MALAGLLALSACATAGSPAPRNIALGTSVHSITIGKFTRSRLSMPTGLPAAAPLFVMLHGGFGTAHQAERAYG